jgi:hypothetical protein
MRHRLMQSLMAVAVATAGAAVISLPVTRTSAPVGAPSGELPAAAPKTPWAGPDLQGIWMDEVDTPLQRPAKYVGQEWRIVETPGGISMFYEIPFGQGFQRNIVMDGSPHLPAGIRQWLGDSRGHWEGERPWSST